MKINLNVGFLGLLTVLFVALKLMGYIMWAWFWVISPLFFGFTIGVLFVGGYVAYAIIKEKLGK
jgi:hypothetical protein